MRTRNAIGGVAFVSVLTLTAAVAFVVGRRWPIPRLDSLMARLRPGANAAALLPWRVVDTVPLTRYENGTALIGRELYIIGGFYNKATQATRQVDVLHLDRHTTTGYFA